MTDAREARSLELQAWLRKDLVAHSKTLVRPGHWAAKAIPGIGFTAFEVGGCNRGTKADLAWACAVVEAQIEAAK